MTVALSKIVLDPGTEVKVLTREGARFFPEGSILEAISDKAAYLAYKPEADTWTITGLDYVSTDAELATFVVGWRVVRWGYSE